MRRRRYAEWLFAPQVKLGDVLCEQLKLGGSIGGEFVLPLGRVTGIGENPDSTYDFWLNSYVDPPDSNWHRYHKDERVIVVRNAREGQHSGDRNQPQS